MTEPVRYQMGWMIPSMPYAMLIWIVAVTVLYIPVTLLRMAF